MKVICKYRQVWEAWVEWNIIMSVKLSKDKPIGGSLWNLTSFIFKMMFILFCLVLAAIINNTFKNPLHKEYFTW